jgi:3-hydroxy-9,10-secoandrosta-1,3,5(10)-triene-9,17-dione monooxygenase
MAKHHTKRDVSVLGMQFLDHPLQRAKRDVDVISGHVVFDYDVSRELAGALEIGAQRSALA